mmetsp:Transcript_10299/g.36100  ORF Transcript_10299/g.36100 Transcript_10299/m.36100 type:complete len:871 (-) Transcript_10299:96-2708(-)
MYKEEEMEAEAGPPSSPPEGLKEAPEKAVAEAQAEAPMYKEEEMDAEAVPPPAPPVGQKEAAEEAVAEAQAEELMYKEEDLRMMARNCLLKAAQSNELEQALVQATSSTTIQDEPEADMEALKSKARTALLCVFGSDEGEEEQEEETTQADCVELTFKNLDFHSLDHVAFEVDLRANLVEMCADKAALDQMTVRLREGSVIAELYGPAATLTEVRAKPLTTLQVMGCQAEVTHGAQPPKDEGEAKHPVDMNELRAQACRALMGAAANGRLEDVLGSLGAGPMSSDAHNSELSALRAQAKNALIRSVENGSLDGVLNGSMDAGMVDCEYLRNQARAALTDALNSGLLLQVLDVAQPEAAQPGPDDLEGLRDLAQKLLLASSEDGRLAAALRDVQQLDAAEPDTEALRELAKATLLTACSDGRLAAILGEAVETEPEAGMHLEALRRSAKDALSAACSDGRLASTLSMEDPPREIEPENDLDMEALRQSAKETLGAACADGRLAIFLGTTDEDAEEAQVDEELRDRARKSLTQGLSNGRLDEVLAAGRANLEEESDDEVEALRDQCRAALAGEGAHGKLLDVLKGIGSEEEAPEGEGEEEDEDEDEDIDVLRAQAMAALAGACDSGQLESVLAASSQQRAGTPPELREVRSEIRNLQAWTSQTKSELAHFETAAKEELSHLCEQARETSTLLAQLRSQAREASREFRAVADVEEAWGQARQVAPAVEDVVTEEAAQECTHIEAMPASPAHVRSSHMVVEDAEEVPAPEIESPTAPAGPAPLMQEKEEAEFPEELEQKQPALAADTSTSILSGGSLAELEQRIRMRNERFRKENEALRLENERLKSLRAFGEETKKLGQENETLKSQLKSTLK